MLLSLLKSVRHLTIDDVHIISKHSSFSINAIDCGPVFVVRQMSSGTWRAPAAILNSKYLPSTTPSHLCALLYSIFASKKAFF